MGEQRVEAVERALSILDAFGDGTPRLSLSEVAERTGLYPSTVLRLAASLDRFGYLHRGQDGLFRLGPTPCGSGCSTGMPSTWRPSCGRRWRGWSTGPARPPPSTCAKRAPRLPVPPRLAPAHPAPCRGRRLAAAGPRRERPRADGVHGRFGACPRAGQGAGMVPVLGERDAEAAAVAAPVFGRGRQFVGALGVIGLRSRLEAESHAGIAAALCEEARLLSREIGA
ncbi:helix-turn-helix domain-containing protein [Pseudoroseomonas wenyumeiae]